ncbi:MAG: peptide chain release factor N(5)-glutamine methyltransferase [Oscillospiraceae bacterium]|nr:peptide chain release factor N(5)-glutamine methyltransferase [Oscillospiraceae bacterium]
MSDGLCPNNAYRAIKAFLSEHGISNPLEAKVIFETALGYPFGGTGSIGAVSEKALREIQRLLEKRITGYPLQYMAGSWPFLDFDLLVGEGVYIPRPETESVALKAIEFLQGIPIPSPVVVDLCSGTGCMAIALARGRPGAAVTAVECSRQAFGYLKKNIEALGSGVLAVMADAFGYELGLGDRSVDLVVCNPPYVSKRDYTALARELYHEPENALTDSGDGLSFYRYIALAYYEKLKPGGGMVFEVGDGASGEVSEILQSAGYGSVVTDVDLFENPRVLTAVKYQKNICLQNGHTVI